MRREIVERPQGIARHGRLRRPSVISTALRAVGVVAAVASATALSLGGIAAWSLARTAQPSVTFQAAAPSGVAVHNVPALSAVKGQVNMLVVASDTRTGQGAGFDDAANQAASSGVGNNDTNLLIHINEQHTSMAVVALPRDLMVTVPACANNDGTVLAARTNVMLNTALAEGGTNHGLQCVASTVASLTGVQIDYAAILNFDGVVKMTNAVGGVSVCLATAVTDNNVTPALNLQPGTHVLKGSEAAAFLRTREGVGYGGDTARISNQQVFMSALMRQIVSGGTLSNPARLYSLASTALQSVQKSSTLDVPTMVKIALAVKSIGLSNIVFVQYPSIPDPDEYGRLLADPNGAASLKAALVANKAIQLSPGALGQSARLASPAPHTSAGAAPVATPKATSSPSADSSAVLPNTATGQSAAQQTCTGKGGS